MIPSPMIKQGKKMISDSSYSYQSPLIITPWLMQYDIVMYVFKTMD